jgi:hypothetical protein
MHSDSECASNPESFPQEYSNDSSNPIQEESKSESKYLNLPHSKTIHVREINGKEDLTDSDLCKTVSPMQTEELLINEKIELLSSENLSISDNFSLTYTKTLGSEASSSFGMRVSNVFINSSPESHNQSFFNGKKNLNGGRLIRSQTENRIDYLKIPNLTLKSLKDDKVKIFIEESLRQKTCEDLNGKNVEGFFLDAEDLFLEKAEEKEDELRGDDLITTGRVFEMKTERAHGLCYCHWCKIF